MKKNILQMTPPDINNGVHKYLFNHMKYLDLNEYRFTFLTRNERDLIRTKEYKQYQFNIKSFQNTERESKNGLRKEIEKILSEGYDAIHLHTSLWRGFLIEEIAMELKVPKVIVHSHSTGVDEISSMERNRLLEAHEQYKKAFNMTKATDVCACSDLAADWLFGPQIPRQQIKIMPNAIEVEKYRFDPLVRKNIRNRLGINERIVVGNVGRYSFQKNQEFLIQVFAKAYHKNSKLFLILIGQGELRRDLISLADKLDIREAVLCMDWQEHVEDYLQAMDVFCLPSHFEGLPISAIEAQAAGLPCYIADTVTEKTAVTELVTYLPLIEEEWQQMLEHIQMNGEREYFDKEVAKKGYDIKQEIELFKALYH